LLGFTFGVFLILIAVRMIIGLLREKNADNTSDVRTDAELVKSRKTIMVGAGLGFFGGASGLLGIGGGTLIVPIMAFALGMLMNLATATSMFTMIFTAISGVTEYYQVNLVNFPVALLFAFGTVFGTQVGAYTSQKLSNRNLSIVFASILIVVGVNMILKYM
jgi:uncharacterized membrane protein YfcA